MCDNWQTIMLNSIIETLISVLNQTIDKFGYFGIFAVTFIENVIPPIPSEFVFPSAGFLASQGRFNIFLVAFFGALGSLAAALVLYYVGYKSAQDHSRKFINKYAKYFFIKPEEIENAEVWFKKYGVWTVFFLRMLPLGRTIISIPAGFIKMNIWLFIALTFVGTYLWCFILTYLGYAFGENYTVISEYTSEYETLVKYLIVLGALAFAYIKRNDILDMVKSILSKFKA